MLPRFGRYPEYRDSGVAWLAEVPEHWDVAALRFRYHQTLGKMLDTKRISGNHLVPYLRNADVQWDRINVVDLPSMDIRPHEIERFTVRLGDLLVCEGGEAGRCALWPGTVDPCGYQKALHRLRPVDGARDLPRFLYFTLIAAVSRDAFADGQGSTFAHLTGDMLRAQRFVFPPPSEQRAIVEFLDRETARIDVLVAKKEKLIGLLREKCAALIGHAVTKGLDPAVPMKDSGAGWLGDTPAHWNSRRLKTLSTMRSGESITSESIEAAGPYPVYGGNGLRGYTSRYTHDGEHVLVGRQGAHCGNVHMARGRFWASEHAVVVTPRDGSVFQWFGALLEAMNLNRQSMAAAQPGLAVEQLRDLRVVVPPVSEQRAIAELLDRETGRIEGLIATVEEGIERLREYRTAVISAAVTGQIDVRGGRVASAVADVEAGSVGA